jgi:hypothetical protein
MILIYFICQLDQNLNFIKYYMEDIEFILILPYSKYFSYDYQSKLNLYKPNLHIIPLINIIRLKPCNNSTLIYSKSLIKLLVK